MDKETKGSYSFEILPCSVLPESRSHPACVRCLPLPAACGAFGMACHTWNLSPPEESAFHRAEKLDKSCGNSSSATQVASAATCPIQRTSTSSRPCARRHLGQLQASPDMIDGGGGRVRCLDCRVVDHGTSWADPHGHIVTSADSKQALPWRMGGKTPELSGSGPWYLSRPTWKMSCSLAPWEANIYMPPCPLVQEPGKVHRTWARVCPNRQPEAMRWGDEGVEAKPTLQRQTWGHGGCDHTATCSESALARVGRAPLVRTCPGPRADDRPPGAEPCHAHMYTSMEGHACRPCGMTSSWSKNGTPCCNSIRPTWAIGATTVWSPTRQCKYMAITLFTTSDYSSDCWWNADESWSLMPASVNSSPQNLLVNTRLWSLTMEFGMPCSHTMLSMKARAIVVMV
jgi:hypothetical protein